MMLIYKKCLKHYIVSWQTYMRRFSVRIYPRVINLRIFTEKWQELPISRDTFIVIEEMEFTIHIYQLKT